MNHRHSASASISSRSGITLLEVLVACGILVVGLASLASVLPAAGSRLAQATVEDRAGVAAANAYSECVSRGLVTSDLFTSSTSACAFGRGLENIVPDIVSPKKRRGRNRTTSASTSITQAKSVILDRIDDVRGFVLEDDLSFLPSSAADTPLNGFITTGTLATGNRLTRPGVCWGGLLAPTSGTAVAGAEATLSIAVFRKEGDDAATLTLNQSSGSLFMITAVATVLSGTVPDTSPAAAVAARKQFMPGCSYVIAIPRTGPAMPKWVRVTSSWSKPDETASYVVLDLDGLGNAAAQANYFDTNTPLTAIGFENLVRVDQYTVTLD
jgi:type II secretory pathway pseudopilin PulG